MEEFISNTPFIHQCKFDKLVWTLNSDNYFKDLKSFIIDWKKVDDLYLANIRDDERENLRTYSMVARINYGWQQPLYFDIEAHYCQHNGFDCPEHPGWGAIFMSTNISLFYKLCHWRIDDVNVKKILQRHIALINDEEIRDECVEKCRTSYLDMYRYTSSKKKKIVINYNNRN